MDAVPLQKYKTMTTSTRTASGAHGAKPFVNGLKGVGSRHEEKTEPRKLKSTFQVQSSAGSHADSPAEKRIRNLDEGDSKDPVRETESKNRILRTRARVQF